MFKNPSFLFDIICTVVWVILMVRYARKGFLASMVGLVGNLLSLLGAHQLSAACAGWVFEHMLAGGFRTQIAANIAAGGAVDLSGRPYLGWDAEFSTEKMGDMATEMVKEFFYAVSYSAAMNLHIKVLSGGNSHHVAEAMFKSFAKALDAATQYDSRITDVLSTKGSL